MGRSVDHAKGLVRWTTHSGLAVRVNEQGPHECHDPDCGWVTEPEAEDVENCIRYAVARAIARGRGRK